MRRSFSDLATLVATGLRGLSSRLLLTVGTGLLATIAVAAAVVGPMYQSSSSASFLVTQLRNQPDTATGLTLDYTPSERVSSAQAGEQALRSPDPAAIEHFESPELTTWSRRIPFSGWVYGGVPAQVALLTEPGICQRLVVTGHCPEHTGEVLLLESDAAYTKTDVGDRLTVDELRNPLTVVGTYRLPTNGGGWFDPSRFASILPQPTSPSSYSPYDPAPFVVAPHTMQALEPGRWFVRMDLRLRVPASTTLDDLRQAVAEVSQLPALLRSRDTAGTLTLLPGNTLRPVVAQTQARRVTAVHTVTPAVVSLILVAMVLLMRLLSTAMDLRRPELALTSLRGIGRRQLWVLAMLEPVLTLAVAAPAGVAMGYLAGRELGAAWLVPGLPVGLGPSSVLFAVIVVLASLAVAALVVRAGIADPLSVQIAGVRRPVTSSRLVVVLRLGTIAAAIVVLAVTLRSAPQSKPSTTDLMLPILLAVAAGLVMTLAAAFAARWWTSRTARRGGVATWMASRTIARRREGTWVILPLTAALAIAVFAAGIYSTAATWRASTAATMVGAQTAYPVKMPLAQAVTLTHALDPNGQWLMAVGAEADLDGPRVIVDAPRLARVAVWPSSWTPGLSVSQVSRALAPRRPPLTLTGRRVQMTVDNQLSGDSGEILLSIDLVAPYGQARHIFLGPYPPGTTTESASTTYCATGCVVSGLSISGPGTAAEAMRGSVRMSDVRVDGSPMHYFTGVGWSGRSNPSYGAPSVTGTRGEGTTLTAEVDSNGRQVVATLAPNDIPAALPVLMGRTTDPTIVARHGNELTVKNMVGADTALRPVTTSESTPFLGPTAMLVDYTMYTRANQVFDPQTSVYVLSRSDIPGGILARLAAHGVTHGVTLDEVRNTLDQDAYALALKLYLVVTVIVLLLAFSGLAATMAVQLPARRRDAASLRVVGLPRRSIVAAVALDFSAVLGIAAIAGILAGALSQYVVVRTITLGYSDTILTPRVLPSLNLTAVAGLLAVSFAVLLGLAVLLGSLTIRGARSATLRESAL